MQSTDIGILVTIKRRVDGRKGKIATYVDPFIADILPPARCGSDKLFPMAPDLAAAVKMMADLTWSLIKPL